MVGITLMDPNPEKICKILLSFLIPGITFLGTSNVVRNERRILQIFSGFGSMNVMPTMRLQYLRQNLNLVNENHDIVIHTLNNDIPTSNDLIGLAKRYCDIVLEFKQRRRNSNIFLSLLLPRFDGRGQENAHQIVNSEITRLLSHISNVYLISHENIANQTQFNNDGLHLSGGSFEIMAQNWLYKIGRF